MLVWARSTTGAVSHLTTSRYKLCVIRGSRRFGLTSVLIAASGGLLAASVVSADASPARARTAACPRLTEAAQLPRWPRGGRLVGDVDGDDSPDSVDIRFSPNSLASCGFLLVVHTHRSVFATRIPEGDELEGDVTIREWRSLATNGDPYLAAIVRLASKRQQIVVSRWHGASVANVSLYGAVGPKLAPLHFRPRTYLDELSLFGSVGTGQTYARCLPGGPLMLLGMGPTRSNRRWIVVRSRYRLTGQQFRLTRSRTVRTSARGALQLAHRWRIPVVPFSGCIVDRGRRL